MKCKIKFNNPAQIFVLKFKSHQELLDNFLELNKGFYLSDIRRYGNVTKCNVYNCLDQYEDTIKITSRR